MTSRNEYSRKPIYIVRASTVRKAATCLCCREVFKSLDPRTNRICDECKNPEGTSDFANVFDGGTSGNVAGGACGGGTRVVAAAGAL